MNFDVGRLVDSAEGAARTHLGKMSKFDRAVICQSVFKVKE